MEGIIKQDQIVQNITEYVYSIEGKDVGELLIDAYKLIDLGEDEKANIKFKQALNIEPDCWSAWLGYASTGGDRSGYLSMVYAYINAYNVATTEKQESDTFIDMVRYLPDRDLKSVFVRAFNLATGEFRNRIFEWVSGVIGCDECEIAALAIDLCPQDWRTYFAMAKFRKIRVRWCKLEGNFFTGKHLPAHAIEVLNVFMRAYRFAKKDGDSAKKVFLDYIDDLAKDNSYAVFVSELKAAIAKEP